MKLADMLAEEPSMPTSVEYVCLDGQAVAEIQRLEREKRLIQSEQGPVKARKAPEGAPPPDPRIVAIDEALEALDDRRRERSGDLTLRATDGGTWTRWVAAHPAREDNDLDELVTGGYCNAEDLIEDLGKYVEAWDGGDGPEPIDAAAWAKLSVRVNPKTLHDLATRVVQLHATNWVALPKSRSASAQTESSATA
jgi:hypothetical protein